MRCPFCVDGETRVLESRLCEEGRVVRRRRECLKCGERLTTFERMERAPVFVVKKDGRRETFDPEKIMKGLLKACEKRPVPVDRLRETTDEIEAMLANSMDSEVASSAIGELIMDKLKSIDDVAYVRFASVYREFKDLEMFMSEMQDLLRFKGQEKS